jgi:Cys-tRNA(Pro)/Cys-tRNA(Cys) deacylase
MMSLVKGSRKTNAMRILESLGIRYEVASYPMGDEHLDAAEVSRILGVSAEVVFKTLVARNERGEPLVFCVRGDRELDLRKAAKASGSKRVELVALRDLMPLTGYVRGGCSPVGMKKSYPTWIDEMALMHERIYVNAGTRGEQMILSAEDLLKATGARIADLV